MIFTALWRTVILVFIMLNIHHFYLIKLKQARPEKKEPCDQDEEEKENEHENEEDLTVPGSSYIQLIALTPRPVLPGMIKLYSRERAVSLSLTKGNIASLSHFHNLCVC